MNVLKTPAPCLVFRNMSSSRITTDQEMPAVILYTSAYRFRCVQAVRQHAYFKARVFLFQLDLTVNQSNAGEFAKAGRGRWCIENQGFNIQKNVRYDIQHADSLDYNAMKCHYFCRQL